MPRPTILGVVGDSAAGKTTLTRGLVRILGEDKVTHVCTDDYHRYDRKQRAERNITPLAPRVQLRGRHGPGSPPPASGRGDPEARLPPCRRHLRPAGLRRPEDLHGRSKGCSATTRRTCATSTTCASSSPRRRTCGGSGRWTATAHVAATRPTRCSPSSTGASPTRPRTSGRRSDHADLVVSFLPGDTDHGAPRRGAPAAGGLCRIPTSRRSDRQRQRRASRCSSAAADRHMRIPGDIRPGAGGRARGGDLGPAPLRQPPPLAAPRRVHDRDRAAPVGVARAGPAADPLPRGDRSRRDRSRRYWDARQQRGAPGRRGSAARMTRALRPKPGV